MTVSDNTKRGSGLGSDRLIEPPSGTDDAYTAVVDYDDGTDEGQGDGERRRPTHFASPGGVLCGATGPGDGQTL